MKEGWERIVYQEATEYFAPFAHIDVGEFTALLFVEDPPTESEQRMAEAIQGAMLSAQPDQ